MFFKVNKNMKYLGKKLWWWWRWFVVVEIIKGFTKGGYWSAGKLAGGLFHDHRGTSTIPLIVDQNFFGRSGCGDIIGVIFIQALRDGFGFVVGVELIRFEDESFATDYLHAAHSNIFIGSSNEEGGGMEGSVGHSEFVLSQCNHATTKSMPSGVTGRRPESLPE